MNVIYGKSKKNREIHKVQVVNILMLVLVVPPGPDYK